MEIPIVLLLDGTALEIKLIIAGNETALHAMKSTEPIKTACQDWKIITIKYPSIATEVKSINAFL
jgi:hypothetical protein